MKTLKSDPRYTVTLEHCGDTAPRFIVRFCGEWVSKHATQGAALMRAAGESARRRGCATVTEQRKS